MRPILFTDQLINRKRGKRGRRGRRGRRGYAGPAGAAGQGSESVITSLFTSTVTIDNNDPVPLMQNIGGFTTLNPAGYWNAGNNTRITNTSGEAQIWIVSITMNLNDFGAIAGDYTIYTRIDGLGISAPYAPDTFTAGSLTTSATYAITINAGSYLEFAVGTPGITVISGLQIVVLQL